MLKVNQILPLPLLEAKVSAPLSHKKRLAVDALFSAAALKELISAWLVEQVPLIEAFCLATALHVVFFPVIWIMGWALPWPRTPVVTTVIEIDLENWPREAKPKKIFNIYDPELNQ